MAGADGWTAEEVFNSAPQGYGLDDIVFLPGPCSSSATPVDFSSKVTRNFALHVPVVSGPSESVTEADMAIAMALMGGVGIIHRRQSIETQAAMVRRVKQYGTGFILQCETLKPGNTVEDARKLMAERGCSGIPLTDSGRMGGKLLGLVTARDLDTTDDRKLPLRGVMTKDLAYVREPVTIKKAREVMAEAKVAKLPVVNKERELVALICRGDLKREREHPNATRDANRSLVCGASVCASDQDAWDRVQALIDAGVDLVSVDTEDGVFPDTIHFIKRVKDNNEDLDILAGPVKSCRQAKALCDSGIDGLRVGGAGPAEATALYEIARFVHENYDIPVLADGEACDVSGMLKALCLGAVAITLHTTLEGTEEAPGDHYYHDGVRVKLRHGQPRPQGPALVEMGTARTAVISGSVQTLIRHLLQGVEVGMQELGIRSLADVPAALADGELRLERQMPREFPEHPLLQRIAVSGLHEHW